MFTHALGLENIGSGQESIDMEITQSSDVVTNKSINTQLPTSIDTAQPEAVKSSFASLANEKVVQTKPIGQLSNASSQTKFIQGTEIPVKINSSLNKGEETKLPLQDYLNPGRTYSNRSAIRIPGDDTKKSKFNAGYYSMLRRNPFRGSLSEHPQDHIENLEELIPDEYNRCKLFSFSLEGEVLRWLNCLPKGSLTCWKEIINVFLKQFSMMRATGK
ncbi:hypothetical protein Bca101_020643 [Brassica carinata]